MEERAQGYTAGPRVFIYLGRLVDLARSDNPCDDADEQSDDREDNDDGDVNHLRRRRATMKEIYSTRQRSKMATSATIMESRSVISSATTFEHHQSGIQATQEYEESS